MFVNLVLAEYRVNVAEERVLTEQTVVCSQEDVLFKTIHLTADFGIVVHHQTLSEVDMGDTVEILQQSRCHNEEISRIVCIILHCHLIKTTQRLTVLSVFVAGFADNYTVFIDSSPTLVAAQQDAVFKNLYVRIVNQMSQTNETLIQLADLVLTQRTDNITVLQIEVVVNREYRLVLADIQDGRIQILYTHVLTNHRDTVLDAHSLLGQCIVAANSNRLVDDTDNLVHITVGCIRHTSVDSLDTVLGSGSQTVTAYILHNRISIEITVARLAHLLKDTSQHNSLWILVSLLLNLIDCLLYRNQIIERSDSTDKCLVQTLFIATGIHSRCISGQSLIQTHILAGIALQQTLDNLAQTHLVGQICK